MLIGAITGLTAVSVAFILTYRVCARVEHDVAVGPLYAAWKWTSFAIVLLGMGVTVDGTARWLTAAWNLLPW